MTGLTAKNDMNMPGKVILIVLGEAVLLSKFSPGGVPAYSQGQPRRPKLNKGLIPIYGSSLWSWRDQNFDGSTSCFGSPVF
jgi:hypothetical protein